MLLALSAKGADTPFCDRTSAMWLNGDKDEVLAVASQRLKNHPGDLAGLILQLQYQVAFFDVVHIKESIDKVIAAGDAVETPNFRKAFPDVKESLLEVKQHTTGFSASEIASEAKKGKIPGKPMEFLDLLQAAERDGLIH